MFKLSSLHHRIAFALLTRICPQFLQIFNDHLVDETLCDPEDSFRVRMESDHGQVTLHIVVSPIIAYGSDNR